jgi:tryptophanyl-tRNA synthetase
MRVLSGIQPTGRFHWGNYFGAIRQYIDLQHGNEAYYFIADLHALTTVRDAARLRQNTLDAALDLLALGLDPAKAILFRQSDVPEVSELCWLLMTVAPMGLLERCVAYKDKKEKGLPADAGLFTYPVLMSADILAYDSEVVPVGADQVQHIEVCRDLAGSFNALFGQTFVLPKAKTLEESAKVPGLDGAKMSKSYDNTIEVFEEVKAARKKMMRITTDARPMEEPTCSNSTPCSRAPPIAKRWQPSTEQGVSDTAKSRRRWPTWPRRSSPKRGPAAPNWRPRPTASTRSSPTARSARAAKPRKY